MSALPEPLPLDIRLLPRADFALVWPIFRDIVRAGDTYAFPADADEDAGYALWYPEDARVYAAWRGDEVVGTFYIRPNKEGPGAHVCNAGFMVPASHSGQGICKQMGAFALEEAVRLGYRAMQFNMVVCTNVASIRIWEGFGFEVIGRVPEGFRLPDGSYSDALIMYKKLV